MAELFIELFSEDIPPKLQTDARQKIKQTIEERLTKKEIKFNLSKSFSTPKRLVFFIDGIPEKIEQKKKTIKGPKVQAPQVALDGFIKSNNLNKKDIYKKNIENGDPRIDVGVLPITCRIFKNSSVQGKQKERNDPRHHSGQAIDKRLLKKPF